jgi:uncharacterized protein YggE
MSKGTRSLILVALLAVSLAACTAVKAAPVSTTQAETGAPSQSPAVARTITVVGQGQVSLRPDIATLNVGVEARADTVAEAKAQVDAQMVAITAALQEAGIAGEDIQTSHYGIHYEREPVPAVREGTAAADQGAYWVSSMVDVTIRDVEEAGDVLDAVVQAGANQVYGVSFAASDESAWESQARAEAMADARSRAQELAELAEVELGEVLSVSEVVGGMAVPMLAQREMGGGGIAPGELELGTQIQVVFAVR